MNYEKSTEILEKIKKAKSVVLVCHLHPDADSIGSNVAFKKVLRELKIKADVFSIDSIPDRLSFLTKGEDIRIGDVFKEVREEGILYIILDIADWRMVDGVSGENRGEDLDVIRIDHHFKGSIKNNDVVDDQKSSTCEMLLGLFEDWGVQISPTVATCLLAGIVDDTGSFQYDNTKSESLITASKLYSLGADRDLIYSNLFRSVKYDSIQLVRLMLDNLRLDLEHKFVWTSIPYSEFEKYKNADKNPMMDSIVQSVYESNFGLRITEKSFGVLDIAIRSRYPKIFDASRLANRLGGGGHKAASGAQLRGNYEECLEKILFEAKEFAKER